MVPSNDIPLGGSWLQSFFLANWRDVGGMGWNDEDVNYLDWSLELTVLRMVLTFNPPWYKLGSAIFSVFTDDLFFIFEFLGLIRISTSISYPITSCPSSCPPVFIFSKTWPYCLRNPSNARETGMAHMFFYSFRATWKLQTPQAHGTVTSGIEWLKKSKTIKKVMSISVLYLKTSSKMGTTFLHSPFL